MSFYVIIRGPAGAGKSAVSRNLAKKLKAYRISFDTIMRKHKLDRIEGKWISEPNYIKANGLAARQAGKKLAKGRAVVFDGCFYHKAQLKHLTRALPYRHFSFTLKAGIKECISRDRKRGKTKIGERAVRDVYKLVSRFGYGKAIDTNGKTVRQVVDKIIGNIK